MAENGRSWVWYAAQEKDSGKLSVLAVVEVVLSVITYWWIAAVWQTHLHLLVALVAAPLVLLRSDASVASAQRMWDGYVNGKDNILLKSAKGISIASMTALACLILVCFAFVKLHKYYEGWSFFWRSLIIFWTGWNLFFAITEAGAIASTVAMAGIIAQRGAIAATIFLPGFVLGAWLRSIITRAISIFRHLPAGIRGIVENWRRTMLSEDASLAPEFLPGVVQHAAQLRLDTVIIEVISGRSVDRVIGSFFIVFLFLPSLLWRYSLKSTCWFYAPLIYVAARGKFADPVHRRLVIDRSPPLLDIGRFLFAVVALGVAFVALVDWSFWRDLIGATEVFSPVGWLLVLDWGKIWDQPWQIPALFSAALTVGIFLWIDSLRKTRRRLEEQGEDPETAADNAYSTEHHPGLTLYRLNRLRTVCVAASLVIGFWYFTKGSYEAGYLTRIEPVLSSVFGQKPDI